MSVFRFCAMKSSNEIKIFVLLLSGNLGLKGFCLLCLDTTLYTKSLNDMKILLCCLTLCSAIYSTYAQVPTIAWETSIGGSNTDKVEKIIATKDGSYVVVGYSLSNSTEIISNNGGTNKRMPDKPLSKISFFLPNNSGWNSGDWNIVIAKVSSTGTKIWAKTFGGSGEDLGYAVQELDNGDFMVCGTTIGSHGFLPSYGHTDIFLMRLDKNGNLIWKKNMGGSSNDYCRNMIKTYDGNLIIAASSNSVDWNLTANYGDTDFWIVKIDTAGNILWQKSYGGNGPEITYSIMETHDRNYMVVGESRSNINGTGNYGDADAFVFKIDSVGNLQWQKHFGGSEHDKFRTSLQLADNSFFILGDTYSNDFDATQNHDWFNRDGFVVKLSATGQTEWVKCYGGNSEDDCRKAVQTSDGKIVILHQIHSPSGNGDIQEMYGEADFWLTKVDLQGNILWQKNYGSSGHEESTDMLSTPDDGFIFVGNVYAYIDYDVSVGYGNDDIWIAKLENREPCRNKLDLSQTVYHNTAEFQAETTINSTVKIMNEGSAIYYKAGTSIVLSPGFEVDHANVFEALIEDCP